MVPCPALGAEVAHCAHGSEPTWRGLFFGRVVRDLLGELVVGPAAVLRSNCPAGRDMLLLLEVELPHSIRAAWRARMRLSVESRALHSICSTERGGALSAASSAHRGEMSCGL